MLEISDNETNPTVLETIQTGKIILMFYTDWCPLCPPIIDILTKLEQEEQGRFKFIKINFDKNPISAKEFGIVGVPMMLSIDNKMIIEVWGKLTTESAYRKTIRKLLDHTI